MNDEQDILAHPGQQLRLFLEELYPLDHKNKTTFISRIDEALRASSDFSEIVYASCINYMVRRLITVAEYIKQKGDKIGQPEYLFIRDLRDFIREETRIPPNKVEELLFLLLNCVKVRNKKPTPVTKKRIRRKAQEKNELNCYICGVSLDFEQDGRGESAEVEHVWPNALGGPNNDFNLRMSCHRCNTQRARCQSKKDFIDASDFHYEEICLVHDKADGEAFSIELRRDYEVALWSKSNFECATCGRPASYVGRLEFCRQNQNDSWHFLNIDAYCHEHKFE
jgi:hypothetical protein